MVNNVIHQEYLPQDIFHHYFFPAFRNDLKTLSSVRGTCVKWNLFVDNFINGCLVKTFPHINTKIPENTPFWERYRICIQTNQVTTLYFTIVDTRSFHLVFGDIHDYLRVSRNTTPFQIKRIEDLQKFCCNNQIEQVNSLFQNGIVAFYDICDQRNQWVHDKTNIQYFPTSHIKKLLSKDSEKEFSEDQLLSQDHFLELKIQGESVYFYIYRDVDQIPEARTEWAEWYTQKDKTKICPQHCFVPGFDEKITTMPALPSNLPQNSDAYRANMNRSRNITGPTTTVNPQAIAHSDKSLTKSPGSEKKRKGFFTGSHSSLSPKSWFKRSHKSNNSDHTNSKEPKKNQPDAKRSPDETKPKDKDKDSDK